MNERRVATRLSPAVEVERPVVPELTGEPVEDVRRLFALTYGQLGTLLGMTASGRCIG